MKEICQEDPPDDWGAKILLPGDSRGITVKNKERVKHPTKTKMVEDDSGGTLSGGRVLAGGRVSRTHCLENPDNLATRFRQLDLSCTDDDINA